MKKTMTKLILLFALLLLPLAALGQGNAVVLSFAGVPSGSCAFVMFAINASTGDFYNCQAGNWHLVGPTAAGAVSLSSVTNLTGNKQFDSGAFTLVWNTSSNSGAANPFSVTDFATNTGTGYLFTISSGSSSAIKPFRACYRGTTDCIVMNTTQLTVAGAATIDSTSLLTKTWASPAAIGTGTPAAATFTTITGNTSLTTPLWTVAESAVANGSGTTTWNIGVDSTSHALVCKNSLGASCLTGGGGTTTNALTMNNSGSGAASGTTFDGSVARTISYNTVGAASAGATYLVTDTTGSPPANYTVLTAGSGVSFTPGPHTLTLSASGSGSPGGATTQVQYNSAGSFAGSSHFTYDDGAFKLSVDNLATGTSANKTTLDSSALSAPRNFYFPDADTYAPIASHIYTLNGPTANRTYTLPDSNATLGMIVASGTSAMGTSAISSGTCATVVTTAATGALTTDNIIVDPTVDPTGVTGYAPSASGSLFIYKYITSGNVNFKVCNNTSSSVTPGALTLQWRVVR